VGTVSIHPDCTKETAIMHKVLSTIAVATGLTGAAFFGGVAVSSLASAQDDAPPTTEAPETAPEATPEETPEGAPEGCRGPGRGAGMEAAAEALGMTAEELRTALRDQTLAQVAEANGVDIQVVIDAMVAEAQEHLAEKVAAGEMTQEEADEKLANLEERITERVNSNKPPRRFGPGRPGGRFGEAPGAEPEVEGSSFSTETASPFAA
jgi:hypothetical protein